MNEVDDRRQRAREAYADTPEPRTFDAVESAIKVAITIKLTPEMVSAVHEEMPGALRGDAVTAIRRFCAVAGLEVIE